MLKEINEAYEILSNPEKKALYDQNLKNETISQEDYDRIYYQNEELREELNNLTNDIINKNYKPNQEDVDKIKKEEQELEFRKQQIQYQEQMEQARQKAYHDAYIQDLKNRGYRIKYKKSLKDYIKGIIFIILVILVLILLWHVPFIQNFFINLYENNPAIHYVVDFFSDIFN